MIYKEGKTFNVWISLTYMEVHSETDALSNYFYF